MQLKDHYGLLINGEWVPAENGKEFETKNPATGEHLAFCADASAALSCASPTLYDGSSCTLEAAAVRSESSEGFTLRMTGRPCRSCSYFFSR